MADKETVFIRGENGVVVEHDLPLPPGVQDRVDRQQLHRVNEDGSPWAPEPEKSARRSAAKAEDK